MNEQVIKRLGLFPINTHIHSDEQTTWLEIGGIRLADLAQRFGTPLYLYDRTTLETSLDEYNRALRDHYPGRSGITYAGKAYLSTAMAQWAKENDLWVDCTGIGELAIARTAGLSRRLILVHGVNKTDADLKAALEVAGTVVVDNLFELERLSNLLTLHPAPIPEIWLRLRPGFAVDTHSYTQTGQVDSKFGMSPDEILMAARFCLDQNLPLTGLHFHQGSHFHELSPLQPALEITLELISTLYTQYNWQPKTVCTGGGWGIAYHEDELPHPDVRAYIQFISANLVRGCKAHGLPLPHLQIEPGRSLVARAGVAIYQAGAGKKTANRQWVLLDGGMADNIRPAFYGARYSALPVEGLQRDFFIPSWLAGPYCESSDILIQDLPLPDIQPGEYIAIPVSGAYQLSMSSNYNGARRPAVVWIENGKARLIQRREKLEELYQRDLPLDS